MKTDTHSNKRFWGVLIGSSILLLLLALIAVNTGSMRRPGILPRMMEWNGSEEAGVATSMPGADYMYGNGNKGIAVQDSFMPSPEPPRGGQTAAEAEQRIIKTGSLEVTVDGVEKVTYDIVNYANGLGGFVQSSTIQEDNEGNKYGYLTIRVPSDKFEEAISNIKERSIRVETESIEGRDVTEQYTDLEARLRSARAQEEQYLEILQQAETVQDILAVQQYLQSIRYEIESLDGQLQSLGNQTEYSTISVRLSEDVRLQIPTHKFDLGRDAKLAVEYVILLAQAGLTMLVWLVIVGGAVFIPLGLLGYTVYRLVRRFLFRH